jgi:hypothetical protein
MWELSQPRDLHEELTGLRMDPSARRPHAALRRQLLQLLESASEGGIDMNMLSNDWSKAPLYTDLELSTMPAHLLLVWCDDLDGCSLHSIPLAAQGPLRRLLEDARLLKGHCFADGGDCSPAQLGAVIRLMAAMGPWPAKKVYEGWKDEIEFSPDPDAVGIASADDVAPYSGLLRSASINSPTKLDQHIVEIVTVSKAC